jgi:hypothetical protein
MPWRPDHRAFATRKPDIALAIGRGREDRRFEDGLDGPVWSGIGRGTRTLRRQRSARDRRVDDAFDGR